MVTLEEANSVTSARTEIQRRATEERLSGPVEDNPLDLSTVGKAIDAWNATLDARPVTLAVYKADCAAYKRLLGEEKLISAVTFQDVEKLFTTAWKGRAGRTKIKHRAMLVRFFDWTAKANLTRGNPARDVVVQRKWSKESSKAAQTTGQALTLTEARKLLEECRGKRVLKYERERFGRKEKVEAEVEPPDYLWWFVLISLRTGLRYSNVVGSEEKPGLLWRHVDLESGTVEIEARLMKNDLNYRVPIHAELLAELKELLRSMDRIPDPGERVVPGFRDGQELKYAFAGALERSGLGKRGFRLHDLRHTFLSWLGEFCTHSVMQRLAGHAAQTVTDRYALHQEMETLRRGLDSLPWIKETGAGQPVKVKA
jgi:integrase